MSFLWTPVAHVNLLYGLVIGLPDAAALAQKALAYALPRSIVFAIAYEETRRNTSPLVRGAHGEIGRFQIKPSTARRRCPGTSIYTWDGNSDCFFQMFSADADTFGTYTATRIHNGRGKKAYAYRRRVNAHTQVFHDREFPFAQDHLREDPGCDIGRGTSAAYRAPQEDGPNRTPSPTARQETL